MSKIAIVGDVHIATGVSTRKDNYFETCLGKLRQIFDNNDYIIFGGDLFHTPVLPLDKFYSVYLLFKEYQNTKEFYSIVGNHDLFNMNEQTLYKTSLGLLELTGLIHILREGEILEISNKARFEATALNFGELKPSEHDNYFLFHHFYNLNCQDSLNDEMLNSMFPNMLGCFCFHDHETYEPLNGVYRPGSLMRNAATEYNKKRIPVYYQIDSKTGEISLQTIVAQRGEDIFVDNALIKKRERFIEDLNNTINMYSEKIETNEKYSMIEILKEIKTPRKSMEYIMQTCKVLGVPLK